MRKDKTKEMPLLGHLSELRNRLFYSAIAVVVCCIGTFIAKTYVYDVLMYPLHKGGYKGNLVAFGMTEGFMSIMKITIYAGVLIALPFLLWQFWAFILPALYDKEKKAVLPYVGLSTVLFLGGVVFCFFLVLPFGIRWLINFGSNIFDYKLRADSYFPFVAWFLLAFGAVFELPLVMMLLALAGIVNHRGLRRVRRWAIIVEAFVAMVITPGGDPISMILMFIPLLILYELGIWLAVLMGRRRLRRKTPAVVEN
jgi:sec-independent protein translocase protein TatC